MSNRSVHKGYKVNRRVEVAENLSGLASATVEIIDNTFESLPSAFLMKKIIMDVQVHNSSTSLPELYKQGIMIGVAQGLLSAAEIEGAIEAIVTNPRDPTEDLERTEIDQYVVNKSLFMIPWTIFNAYHNTSNNVYSLYGHLRAEVDLGKGILFPEDRGWTWFVYNCCGATWDTGYQLNGFAHFEGVYLND